tara:strand:+ start:20058 stop:21464 length:1407 start_codon:yes stop_codon:yes gene_type:complete
MSYILIPSVNFYDKISFFYRKIEKTDEIVFVSKSLFIYLNRVKENIYSYTKDWDFYKKITNPYEYIHTHIINKNFSISKYKPLSRSFFKMIEIINVFDFLNEEDSIKSFHLAEGPGGFIEAFNYYRKTNLNENSRNDRYYGITLISDNQNIPSWKKGESYIKHNSNIFIEYGKSNNGDLFNKHNIIYFSENYSEKMNYVTADGGFDFSTDFNNQEELSYKLILAQILYALIIQKKNGKFVLKIFDVFKYKTIELIYLLSIFYDLVFIYKPSTSRVANSEKYLICKKFKGLNPEFKNEILNEFENLMSNSESLYSIFNFSLSKNFIYKIKEINAIYGQQQLENINNTLNFIREITNLKHSLTNKEILTFDSCIFFLKDIDVIDLLKNSNDLLKNNNDLLKNNNDLSNNNFLLQNNNINEKIIIYDKDEKNHKNLNKLYNKLHSIVLTNVQKSIYWCRKYKIELNKSFIY